MKHTHTHISHRKSEKKRENFLAVVVVVVAVFKMICECINSRNKNSTKLCPAAENVLSSQHLKLPQPDEPYVRPYHCIAISSEIALFHKKAVYRENSKKKKLETILFKNVKFIFQ